MGCINNMCFFIACLFVLVKQSDFCALPYWWVEAYSLSNKTQLLLSEPGRSYHYRESFQVFDLNNYFHIKELSWWEHGGSTNNGENNIGFNVNVDDGSTKNSAKAIGGRSNTGTKTSSTKKPTVMVHTANGNAEVESTRAPEVESTRAPEVESTRLSEELSTRPSEVESPRPSVVERNRPSGSEEPSEVERNENEADGPALEELQERGDDLLQADQNSHKTRSLFPTSWLKKANETKPCKTPDADIHSLRNMIEKMFSFPRNHALNPENKEKARQDILSKFRSFGLQVWTQNFSIPSFSSSIDEDMNGVNLIGVIPGFQRGHLDDGIVLVGAHYDTVANSNGVDDNGSGLAVMLEVAKALSSARCRFNNTLMFVAFDREEDGAVGSNHFVEQYLIPEELKRARAHFQGAFILDGVLNFNNAPNTQQIPRDFAESLPGLQSFVNYTGNRGDFLAMISRNSLDNHLTTKLMEAWQKLDDQTYKLFNLAVDMGNDIPSPSVLENHLNFLSSDHSAFWYHNSSTLFPESLNAVLLTDTGPFRGMMQKCYHSECDDLSNMSPEKLQFAKKTADALTATLVEMTRATATGNLFKANNCIFSMLLVVLMIYGKYIR